MNTTTPTKENVKDLEPLVISPLYSDCTVRVPLDDGSGFQDYKLHLCMLYESPYFEEMNPKSKKVRQVVTCKSLFEIILRYIYNKKQIIYTDENILDIITEGYRYSLNDLVNQLWSTFNQTASAKMVIEALKRLENREEFSKRWGLSQLQTAVERNVLNVLDMATELKEPKSIQFVVSCAKNQNPCKIVQTLFQWDAYRQNQGLKSHNGFIRQVSGEILCWQNSYPINTLDGSFTRLLSADKFSEDYRSSKTETSYRVKIPCVIGASQSFKGNQLTIRSISPLVVELVWGNRWGMSLVVQLWDSTGCFYITKACPGASPISLQYDIKNAQEWAVNNALLFQVIISQQELIQETIAKENITPLPPFNYPTNRARLSDFMVECHDNNGLVTYKLHKFILQQSPHFQRMFAASSFIESKSNKVTLETPKHLFEVILRYLYNQDPYIGISNIITDVIQEASYFELAAFEKELWSLFDKEVDVTNCIKAINLMGSNMLFEMHQANILSVVARHIKAVLDEISKVPQWSSVKLILSQPVIKQQNPILVLESVAEWCQVYDKLHDCKDKVTEIFRQVFEPIPCSPKVAKELKAKFPFLPEIKSEEDAFEVLDTLFVTEGQVETSCFRYKNTMKVSDQSEIWLEEFFSTHQLRLYDQLSHHYVIITPGTKLNQVVDNINEWKYGGCYRVELASLKIKM